MKHSDAVRHLRAMLFTLQRARSITKEELVNAGWPEKTVQSVLETLLPWIHGDKCPVPALVKILDRVENGDRIDGMDFYNLVTIATLLQPSLLFLIGSIGNDLDFPKQPSIQWVKGWD
jgi:hypothetical protein